MAGYPFEHIPVPVKVAVAVVVVAGCHFSVWRAQLKEIVVFGTFTSLSLSLLGFVLRYFYLYFYILYTHLFICLSACLTIYLSSDSFALSPSPSLFLTVVNALLVVVVVDFTLLALRFSGFLHFYQYPQSLGSVHLPKKEKRQQ